jgi:hypothetical protein
MSPKRALVLKVACRRCDRRGRLNVARLIREHGPDARLPDLKDVLAGNCPKFRNQVASDRCEVHFPDLVALFPLRDKTVNTLRSAGSRYRVSSASCNAVAFRSGYAPPQYQLAAISTE